MAAFIWQAKGGQLPVAGLDPRSAQTIIFALQQECIQKPEDEDVVRQYLFTLQLSQVFHERLLHDLEVVDSNLAFWARRLQEGSHVQFMLLQRGPATFLRYLTRSIQRFIACIKRGKHKQSQTSSEDALTQGTQQPRETAQSEQPRSGFRSRLVSHSESGSLPRDGVTRVSTSATNKMQRRVLLLEALRNLLAESLAQVASVSRLLWLNTTPVPSAALQVRPGSHAAAQSWAAQGLVQATGQPSLLGATRAVIGPQAQDIDLLQIARDRCTQVTQQLLELHSDLHKKLQGLGTEQTSRVALHQAAVSRVLTGSATIVRRHRSEVPPLSLSSLPSMRYSMRIGTPASLSTPRGVRTTTSEAHPRRSFDKAAFGGADSPTARETSRPHSSQAAGLPAMLHQLETALQVQLSPYSKQRKALPRIGSIEEERVGLFGTRQAIKRNAQALWRWAEEVYSELQDRVDAGFEDDDAQNPNYLQPTDSAAIATVVAGTSQQGSGTVKTATRKGRRKQVRAANALRDASAAARKAGSLACIPPWALQPSWFQRSWVSCSIAGMFALMGMRWLWRHSPLGGSDDLVRWSRAAWQATQSSVQAHVIGPLWTVHEELTRTFRDRPSIVSPHEFEADKQSLLRMLTDFERDVGKPGNNTPASGLAQPVDTTKAALSGITEETLRQSADMSLDAKAGQVAASDKEQEDLLRGMQLVMATYERELQQPVRNLLVGQLTRSLLIQGRQLYNITNRPRRRKATSQAAWPPLSSLWWPGLIVPEATCSLCNALLVDTLNNDGLEVQRLKLDTEAAMLELDQILRANELSISLVAAIPALALLWAGLRTVTGWMLPRAPDVKHAAVPCRMAAATLERSIQKLAEQEQAVHAAIAAAAEQNTTTEEPLQAGEGDEADGGFGDTEVQQGVSEAQQAAINTAAQGLLDAEGMVIYHIHKVYHEAVSLFRVHDTRSRHSEWPSLSADLSDLATAAGAKPRLKVLDRMLRSYKVFKS